MKNKNIALVTGGSKGIGRAIVYRLVKDGYFVIVTDIDIDAGADLCKELGEESIEFLECNVSQEGSVRGLFQTIKSKYKRLNVLINNAGIIRDNLIWNMSEEDFDAVIGVNLKGTWLMCREASNIMKQQAEGRIINISSRAWLGNKGQSNYSASKAGVIALTRVLALELGKYNIYVNAIAPGLIDTPLSRNLKKEVLDKLIDAQPTKTMGKPEDVANLVAFLASEQTHFITGQTIYVDGGKNIGAGI